MNDIEQRLSDEADLCRNDGADDIATLLDEAQNVIKTFREIASTRLEAMARARHHLRFWLPDARAHLAIDELDAAGANDAGA